MIELISISVILLLTVSVYLNEMMINKNKIQFDLLKDRDPKKATK